MRGVPQWAKVTVPLLLLSSFIVAWLAAMLVYGLLLYSAVWLRCGWRGPMVLIVYENSLWRSHIEAGWLPPLPPGSMVLIWSERKRWRRLSLPVRVFRFVGGSREYNPLAVIIRPFRLAKTIRFFKPFRALRGGATRCPAAGRGGALQGAGSGGSFMSELKRSYSQGQYVGGGVAVGVGIGTAIGVASGNLGLWLPLGIAIGVAVGLAISKNRPKA